MLVLLVLAAIVDASLALLLVAVSGFVLGPGPESSNGDPAAVISWTVALIGCIAAPIAGFILRAYRMAGIGVLVALVPPLVALFLTSGSTTPTESVLKWRVRCRGCGARGERSCRSSGSGRSREPVRPRLSPMEAQHCNSLDFARVLGPPDRNTMRHGSRNGPRWRNTARSERERSVGSGGRRSRRCPAHGAWTARRTPNPVSDPTRGPSVNRQAG